jgi:hypothetical protein
VSLFRRAPVDASVAPFAESSWQRLEPLPPPAEDQSALPVFSPDESFFNRRLKSIDQFVEGCEQVLAGEPLARKIICSRYTNGLPDLDPVQIRSFSQSLDGYAMALRATAA